MPARSVSDQENKFNPFVNHFLADEHCNFQESKAVGEEDCDDSDSNSSQGPTYANLEPLDPEGLQAMELDLRYFRMFLTGAFSVRCTDK